MIWLYDSTSADPHVCTSCILVLRTATPPLYRSHHPKWSQRFQKSYGPGPGATSTKKKRKTPQKPNKVASATRKKASQRAKEVNPVTKKEPSKKQEEEASATKKNTKADKKCAAKKTSKVEKIHVKRYWQRRWMSDPVELTEAKLSTLGRTTWYVVTF